MAYAHTVETEKNRARAETSVWLKKVVLKEQCEDWE